MSWTVVIVAEKGYPVKGSAGRVFVGEALDQMPELLTWRREKGTA
jgi:hypothetical protein